MKKFLSSLCVLLFVFGVPSIMAFNEDLSVNVWVVKDGSHEISIFNQPNDFEIRVDKFLNETFRLYGGTEINGLVDKDVTWKYDSQLLDCWNVVGFDYMLDCESIAPGVSTISLQVIARLVDGSTRSIESNLVTVRITDVLLESPSPFSDLYIGNAGRFQGEILDFYRKGLIQGYSDGTFRPLNPINRAEFLKILFEVSSAGQFRVNTEMSRSCFPDVPANEWYTPYVCQAKNLGMVRGYPDGTFRPAQSITLPEALKLLLLRHADNDSRRELRSGEEWYEPIMQEASRLGLLPSHLSNWRNFLLHNVTRDEFVLMSHRAAEGFFSPIYFN